MGEKSFRLLRCLALLDLAIRYGYQRFRPDIMIATVVILIVLVQIVQFLGNRLANGLNKK